MKNYYMIKRQDIMNILLLYIVQKDKEYINIILSKLLHYFYSLIKICITVIDRMLEGTPFEDATDKTQFDQDSFETNRLIMKKYFEQMRYALYLPK